MPSLKRMLTLYLALMKCLMLLQDALGSLLSILRVVIGKLLWTPVTKRKLLLLHDTEFINLIPFGLCNTPATFQRLMDRVYKGIAWKFVVVYLDDTIVYSRTFDEHLTHLKRVFNRIKQAGLRLNIEKCTFWMHQLPFLGHLISAKGIAPDP